MPDPGGANSGSAADGRTTPDSSVVAPSGAYFPDSKPVEPSARDRAALAAALDPIITINASGIVQSASDSLHRVLGWMPSEIIGRNVSVLMPAPHRSGHDGYLANYRRTGQTNIMNRPRRFEALRKDGTRVPIELCVSRAEMQPGETPLFVGIIRDMSVYDAAERNRDQEREHSQQLLAEQTSALQQANLRLRMSDRMASIGTLAAGLGHDMNNVLLPVRARLNALKAAGQSGKLAAGERKHVEEIRKSVAYLQQLADGLHFLALDPETEEDSRGGGASTDLRQWWTQAGPLLSKAVPKHVRVIASFSPDLPPIALASHGLTQAVLNLVVNAGESIPSPSERKRRQGCVRVAAESLTESGKRWVLLRVSDNGVGMTEDVKRRAFEMFFTTKPRGLGTGLGLALVRNVVERSGGHVEINSDVSMGTTVLLKIPMTRQPDPAPGEPARAMVSLRDGRAFSLVSHMLESSGIVVQKDGNPSESSIWVVDPAAVEVREAGRWKKHCSQGRLVLLGRPPARHALAWNALSPLIIENPGDFEALKAAFAQLAHVGGQGRS